MYTNNHTHSLSLSHSHSHQIKAKGSGSRPRLALDSPGRRGGAVWVEVPKLCGLQNLQQLYRSGIKGKHKQNRLKPASGASKEETIITPRMKCLFTALGLDTFSISSGDSHSNFNFLSLVIKNAALCQSFRRRSSTQRNKNGAQGDFKSIQSGVLLMMCWIEMNVLYSFVP